MRFAYHVDGTLPDAGQVFVFGSNARGAHGKGAALVARQHYGAVLGVGSGLRGMSYAIPTKNSKLEPLSLRAIECQVEQFVVDTYLHPHLRFFVTRVGCGLAGWGDDDVSPFFRDCHTNCSFAEDWRIYLEPTAGSH